MKTLRHFNTEGHRLPVPIEVDESTPPTEPRMEEGERLLHEAWLAFGMGPLCDEGIKANMHEKLERYFK